MNGTVIMIALLCACGVAAAGAIVWKRYKYSIFRMNRMSGLKFEKFIARIYEKSGYKSINTKASGDQGIDLIVKKGFIKTGIQVKRYDRPVGNHAVQEAVAGKRFYGLDRVAVVTNNTFTRSARELAEANKVELIDGERLQEMIKRTEKNK
ncbi:MAG: restriction endonuclease [Clostridia bacterium]|nr:restriction endonuclease [Clostridia bacterium]